MPAPPERANSDNWVSQGPAPFQICRVCFQKKPLHEFRWRRDNQKYRTDCKDCCRSRIRMWQVRHRGTSTVYNRTIWPLTRPLSYESNKRKHEYTRWWYRKLYPERYTAEKRVSSAIRSGKLISRPCEVCGGTKSQAHHDDYSKPLDVRWLCAVHHKEADRNRRIQEKSILHVVAVEPAHQREGHHDAPPNNHTFPSRDLPLSDFGDNQINDPGWNQANDERSSDPSE